MKKTLLFTACGVLLAGYCTGCQKKQAQQPQAQPAPLVTVGKVTEQANIEKRTYAGVVVSPSVVTLMPRVSGEIKLVGFKEGDKVKKGDVLYKFDETRYQAAVSNALAAKAKALADIERADADIANAKARIAESDARLTYAQSDYDRKLKLSKQNVTSDDKLENAKSVLDACINAKAAAEASLKAAEAAKKSAEASLAAAEAALITAQDDLDNTTIIAPMDGVIGVNNFSLGNYVTPASGAMASIKQITPIRVQFAMSNRDYLEMFGSLDTLKKEAVIKLKLADDTVLGENGTVEFIDNTVSSRTDTIQVFAVFNNASEKLRPGATVTVTIERTIAEKALAIPPSAVMNVINHLGQTEQIVYLVNEKNAATKRKINIVSMHADYVFIQPFKTGKNAATGLNTGDRIVIDGTHKIRFMPNVTEVVINPVEK
ncbi:MAG: efflux RND transporter periplasmic adaptor subunit [Lentisphaerae bacterium]|nr:efflux RND transporter periplasmic adaptor subunit [Lentisphaerota bacterium]